MRIRKYTECGNILGLAKCVVGLHVSQSVTALNIEKHHSVFNMYGLISRSHQWARRSNFNARHGL